MKQRRVALAIQARLNSTRLPYKILKNIGNFNVLEHVIKRVNSAAIYINRHAHRTGLTCDVYVLTPAEDADQLRRYLGSNVELLEGPENDVLTRYALLVNKKRPDYIVRITSDCPLIPSAVIVKSINTAVKGGYNFVTNAWPNYRTFFDGADCEIVDARLFNWLNSNATGADREHVMSLLYRERPDWCNYAMLFNNHDMYSIQKLSLDTEEDLKNIRLAYEKVEGKINRWITGHGKQTCHRY